MFVLVRGGGWEVKVGGDEEIELGKKVSFTKDITDDRDFDEVRVILHEGTDRSWIVEMRVVRIEAGQPKSIARLNPSNIVNRQRTERREVLLAQNRVPDNCTTSMRNDGEIDEIAKAFRVDGGD